MKEQDEDIFDGDVSRAGGNSAGSGVSLEDLLSLKRCEKPSESDWERFDAELKSRMMASLVEKEPVWIRAGHFLLEKKVVSSGAALAFVFSAVVAVAFVFSADSSPVSGDFSEETFASSTPLPKVKESFAEAKISSKERDESLVSASMGAGTSGVQYVSNGVFGTGLSAF